MEFKPCLDEHQTQAAADDTVAATAICSRNTGGWKEEGEFQLFHNPEDRQEDRSQMKAMADAAEVLIALPKNRPLKQIIGQV